MPRRTFQNQSRQRPLKNVRFQNNKITTFECKLRDLQYYWFDKTTRRNNDEGFNRYQANIIRHIVRILYSWSIHYC